MHSSTPGFLLGFPSVLFGVLFLSLLQPSLAAPPIVNITVLAPNGTSNHGDSHLLCTPTKWTDIAIFFLGNYVSHAATVQSSPGATVITAFILLLTVLFFPFAGVVRGIIGILRSAKFSETPLEMAAKAEALCMVVRTTRWRPQTRDVVKNIQLRLPLGNRQQPWQPPLPRGAINLEQLPTSEPVRTSGGRQIPNLSMLASADSSPALIQSSQRPPRLRLVDPNSERSTGLYDIFMPAVSDLNWSGRKVHGTCFLPDGYALALIPNGVPVSPVDGCKLPQQDLDSQSLWKQIKSVFARLILLSIPSSNFVSVHERLSSIESPSLAQRQALYISAFCAYFQRQRLPVSRNSSDISSIYSFTKALVAILQTIFASATLYRSRGDQIQRYGYAAFGLTVIQYLLMSVVNLIYILVTPAYPTMYLVYSDIMSEAARRPGARFDGMVGSIQPQEITGYGKSFDASFEVQDDGSIFMNILRSASGQSTNANLSGDINVDIDAGPIEVGVESEDTTPADVFPRRTLLVPSHNTPKYSWPWRVSVTTGVLFGLLISIPIAIIGGMTHFRTGQSTKAQRVWTMTWLCFSFFIGPYGHIVTRFIWSEDSGPLSLGLFLFYGAPAIGGFIVVGQMLQAYGRCIRIY